MYNRLWVFRSKIPYIENTTYFIKKRPGRNTAGIKLKPSFKTFQNKRLSEKKLLGKLHDIKE